MFASATADGVSRGPEPRGRSAILILLILCTVSTFGYMHRFMPGLFVDPISAEFGIDDIRFGLLQGATFAFAYAAASLVVGPAVDRLHRVRLLAVGALLWTLGSAIMAVASGFGGLVLGRLVVGIGETFILPAIASLIWDIFPPHRRGAALGALSASTSLGVSASVIVPGFLFDALDHLSPGSALAALPAWRMTFLLVSMLGLAALLPLLLVREPVRLERQATDGGRAGLVALWPHRAMLWPLLAGSAFIVVAELVMMGWIPTVLIRDFGLARSAFSDWYAALIFAVSATGALVGGFLADRAGRSGRAAHRLLPALGGTLLAAPMGLCVLAPEPWLFALLFGAMWIGLVAASLSILTALTAQLPNELRGSAIGTFTFVNAIAGFGIGQSVVPFVAEGLGPAHPLGLAVALTAIGAMLLAIGVLAVAWRRSRLISAGG